MTARVRKTFHYPTEEDDSAPSDLDEEEQEQLITTLRTRDDSNTGFYKRAFLALPLLSLLIYLPTLSSASSARSVILTLLSWTSLLSTVYILHYAPPRQRDRPGHSRVEVSGGPIDQYLPWLNAGLSAVLALAALLAWRRGLVEEAWRGFYRA
ncbi:hypothetical protein H2203_008268 [Taxawa tesnikishii (nom. ined.)]|nr:hypothetical protein H2203_008268 [Dothideales sp. JES 119]